MTRHAAHFRPSGNTPLYLQLESSLRDALAHGRFRPGEALPAEREFARDLGVSRITLRRALERLETLGLVVRRHGSGTFVAQRVEQSLTGLTSFTEDLRARGRLPGVHWTERRLVTASAEEALALGLGPQAQVARLERVRLADGEPLALERAVLSAQHLPDPQDVTDSLYSHLQRRGLRPERAVQRLRAAAAAPREAELLSIAPGAPVLSIERLSFLPGGAVLEFTRSHYRGDRYDFVAELHAP